MGRMWSQWSLRWSKAQALVQVLSITERKDENISMCRVSRQEDNLMYQSWLKVLVYR